MKKVLVSVLTIIFIVSMISTVYAATTGSISVGASSDSVIKGKTFTVTVAGTAEANIKAMEAKLSYDANKLAIENKSAGQGFSDLSGSNEIAITASSSEGLSKAATLYTITFKVLDNAVEGETTISVTNAVLALLDAENTEELSDEVTITIKADDTTAGNQGGTTQTPEDTKSDAENTTGNTPSNTTSGDKSNTTSKPSTNNKKNNTTTKLPQTGVESMSVIAIIALGVVAIASFISYRKYKNI